MAKSVQTREIMIKRYSKQHQIERFVSGDLVSLKIPRLDRTSTDLPRIFCRVLAETHTNRYQLQTKFGILSNHFPTKELLRVPNTEKPRIDATIPNIQTIITLHTVAAKVSTSERVTISCTCRGICKGNCRCIKNKVKCSIHCHDDEHNCGNLSAVIVRTEMALVE